MPIPSSADPPNQKTLESQPDKPAQEGVEVDADRRLGIELHVVPARDASPHAELSISPVPGVEHKGNPHAGGKLDVRF